MIINIKSQKMEVTDSIKSYVESKMTKLEKYFTDHSDINANVLIKIHNDIKTIEITIPTKQLVLRAEESNVDLYSAIDLIVDKLVGQIRKNKSRIKKQNKIELTMFNTDFESENEKENEKRIVKRKSIEVKPMSEEEAILQMELLNHDFFLFKNIDCECISVIYKRKDGQYGIIEAN